MTLCCHEVPPGFSPQLRKPLSQSQNCPPPRTGRQQKPQNNRENGSRCAFWRTRSHSCENQKLQHMKRDKIRATVRQ
ncbi:hypothetical protein HMPREF0970_02349 [Schaalia odontolytica F0309]|uniref:Uncharacterized protein n=2 Tax=Schaalia odontolytica TaxID=1660 RepID=A0A857A9E3_9ACTO|nr:hypothetical protein HMPREF0970_02349 [Schaalia odontolytica F0309]QGS11789.1 hypothetical protein FOC40_00100 [Schaalia odontolytica]